MSEPSLRSRAAALGRRLAYLVQRHLLRASHLVARERRFGLRFRFKVEDVVGRHIYRSGTHEEALTRFLVEDLELREGDVVIDAGANLGWFSLLLDRASPEGVTIYAFEPDPVNFALLEENAERNGADGVVPVPTALTDRAGREPLFLYPDKNRGRHSLARMSGAEGTVEVPTTSLEAFWRERGLESRSPALLKIDVEGSEIRVLEGAGSLLERFRVVVTEYAPELLRRAGHEPRRLLERLTGTGFAPHRAEPDGLVPLESEELRGRDEPVDLVWTRPGSKAP